MAANIKSLIRLHEWNVDEKRRKLAELQRLEDELRQQVLQLEAEMKREQETAKADPVNVGRYYATYATHAIERRDNLEKSLEQMAMVIGHAREELSEAYRELKKFETVQRNRLERVRLEQNRREQAVLDEVGLGMHRRRRKG